MPSSHDNLSVRIIVSFNFEFWQVIMAVYFEMLLANYIIDNGGSIAVSFVNEVPDEAPDGWSLIRIRGVGLLLRDETFDDVSRFLALYQNCTNLVYQRATGAIPDHCKVLFDTCENDWTALVSSCEKGDIALKVILQLAAVVRNVQPLIYHLMPKQED